MDGSHLADFLLEKVMKYLVWREEHQVKTELIVAFRR